MYHFLRFMPLIVMMAGFVVFSAMKKDPSNPPTAQTGAPGETTCSTASGCHNGGSYTGTVELTGIPAQITPSTTYTVTITLNSTCKRTGFELTVLDKNNAKCGTLTAGTGNNIKTVGTRQYVRQSTPVTMSGNKGSYTFKWASPATITGDTAVFYYAMLQANANGGTSGDNAVKGSTKVGLSQVSATDDQGSENFTIYPNPGSEFVTLHSPEGVKKEVTLKGLDGKLVAAFTHEGGSRVLDIRHLSAGQYFLKLSDGNKVKTRVLNVAR